MAGSLAANRAGTGDTLPTAQARSAAADAPSGRFFFFHVPKTGGVTIYKAFERSGAVVRPKKKGGSYVDVALARKSYLPDAGRHGDPHIAGHFASLSIIEGREAHYHKVCFWRHPADWFLSYYNWRRGRERERLQRAYKFDDFARTLMRNPMTQEFLLYCGDVPGWRYFFSSDREKFDRALALALKFDLFADISKVDDYLRSLGLADEGAVKHYNAIPEREKALRALDAGTRRRLEREHPVDLYLSRVALGENVEAVVAEAHRELETAFQVQDVVRQLLRPYYRLKVKVLPFLRWGQIGSVSSLLLAAEQALDFLI